MSEAVSRAFRSLERLLEAEPRHRCELCTAALADAHAHLFDTTAGGLVCACDPCALVLEAEANPARRFLRPPRRSRRLPGFRLDEDEWAALEVPVRLAFFVRPFRGEGARACYPSPAGAMRSTVPAGAWRRLADAHPVLDGMLPEIEALLVDLTAGEPRGFLAPIDECYRLVGLLRAGWEGMGGGMRPQIERFLSEVEERAEP